TEFYNTSECRDLLFHVQEEHRTTLPEIKVDLAALGLRFIGFESDAWPRRQYAARFPADKTLTDLDRWHELELDNPLTFVGMYQFWAQRTCPRRRGPLAAARPPSSPPNPMDRLGRL